MFAVKHIENLKAWRNGKRKSMPFAIPMVWREGNDHITDCYFCMINLKEINCKNKHHVQYFDVPSVIRPIPNMAQTFLFLSQMVTWNITLILNSDMTVVAGDDILNEKHLLTLGTMFYWYRDCERELRQFFTFQNKSILVYCNNIAGLIKSMGLDYDATEWILFIGSSSRSLKAVLLHNGNSFSSIPIGHLVARKKQQHGSFAVCC